MFSLLVSAGWPVWPLLFLSVISLALITERLITLRRRRVIPPNLLDEVLSLSKNNQLSLEVIEHIHDNSLFGQVLASGARHINHPSVMKDAMETTGRNAVHELEKNLTTIGTVATVSPLLGLFGTIVGMIEIFASQKTAGADPQQLAHGISVALYTTAFGLMVGIPSLIAHRHLQRQVNYLLNDMEQLSGKFITQISRKND